MTHYEMAEKLSEKTGVTLEEAKLALEACDWDLLDAALLLEKESGETQKAEYTTKQEPRKTAQGEEHDGHWRITMKNIGKLICRAVSCGNRNRFEISRKGEMVMELPITVMVILLIVAFWVCIPLLVIGLFTGFRYSFSGPEFGRESINKAMNQAADAAEKVKDEFKDQH
ncbi:MAG: DUF4342 domain-containing protein [Clostridia bacterium]|nr:DUF4342 domain-containing protein [Clostridia bacterium]